MAEIGGGGHCGGGVCPTGSNKYTATRFEYAKNDETFSFVMGEQWSWDGVSVRCPFG